MAFLSVSERVFKEGIVKSFPFTMPSPLKAVGAFSFQLN